MALTVVKQEKITKKPFFFFLSDNPVLRSYISALLLFENWNCGLVFATLHGREVFILLFFVALDFEKTGKKNENSRMYFKHPFPC